MIVHFRNSILSRTRNSPLYSIFNSLSDQGPHLPQAVNMESKPERPTCPSCSKPVRLCLCIRIRNPGLENAVKVTILQHSLERKHALNSTRIAKLGFKNLTVATVFDIDFEARFVIRLLGLSCGEDSDRNGIESSGFDRVLGCEDSQKRGFESVDGLNLGRDSVKCPLEKKSSVFDGEVGYSSGDDIEGGPEKLSVDSLNFVQNLTSDGFNLEPENEISNGESTIAKPSSARETTSRNLPQYNLGEALAHHESIANEETVSSCVDKILHSGFHPTGDVPGCAEEPVVTATIGKHGVICDFSHTWMLQTHGKKSNYDDILASEVAMDALAKGFVVKKFPKGQCHGSVDIEEQEEFEIEIPPRSVLLFPNEEAVGVNDLEATGFKVKNLIVLDGTWAKAKRMYVENPWLKLLPHLRLDLDKTSLYGEVRHQPKAGYLSTIESIVYGMKAVGDNPEGLDCLLDVFESMVGDQRRCKDERLSKSSQK